MRTSVSPPPSPVSCQNVLTFDVADAMTDDFICTLRMPFCPLFNLQPQDILEFVYSKRPTLKYRKIVIEL